MMIISIECGFGSGQSLGFWYFMDIAGLVCSHLLLQSEMLSSCTTVVCVDVAWDSNSSDLAGRQQLPMVTLYMLFEW
jgi:hypothetical protein